MKRISIGVGLICLLTGGCGPSSSPPPQQGPKTDLVTAANNKAREGNYGDALRDYDRSMVLFGTNHAEIYLKRARLKRKIEDWEGAVADYSQVIRLQADNAEVLAGRGLALVFKGDFAAAELDGASAIRLDPNYVFGYVVRALARENLNRLDEALHDFDTAIGHEPNSAGLLRERGRIKTRKEDFAEAIADFTRALEISPSGTVYSLRGWARGESGDLHGALSDFDSAIRIQPNWPYYYSHRAHAKAALSDTHGALADFDRAIELKTNVSSFYACRGLLKETMNDQSGALHDFRLSVAANATNHPYGALDSWVLRARQGQRRQADEDLSVDLAKQPSTESNEWQQAVARFLLGKIGELELEIASHSPVPSTDHKQQCERLYFIGMKHLLENDQTGAVAALQKCTNTDLPMMCEFRCAKSEILSLKK